MFLLSATLAMGVSFILLAFDVKINYTYFDSGFAVSTFALFRLIQELKCSCD